MIALLLLENGIEDEIVSLFAQYSTKSQVCYHLCLFLLALMKYPKPYDRVIQNERLLSSIKTIEKQHTENNEMVDILFQVNEVMEKGYDCLEKIQSEKENFILEFGPIPKRPPPPLPINFKSV